MDASVLLSRMKKPTNSRSMEYLPNNNENLDVCYSDRGEESDVDDEIPRVLITRGIRRNMLITERLDFLFAATSILLENIDKREADTKQLEGNMKTDLNVSERNVEHYQCKDTRNAQDCNIAFNLSSDHSPRTLEDYRRVFLPSSARPAIKELSKNPFNQRYLDLIVSLYQDGYQDGVSTHRSITDSFQASTHTLSCQDRSSSALPSTAAGTHVSAWLSIPSRL